MNRSEEQLARNVWSRVQGKTPPQTKPSQEAMPFLPQMAACAAALSRQLLILSRYAGKQANTLRQMSRRYGQYTAALRGMCRLQTGTLPTLPPAAPFTGGAAELCRSCIGHLQTLQSYPGAARSPFFPLFGEQNNKLQQDLTFLLAVFSAI